MLRISKKADYAVFLLGAIAREGAYPGGPAAAAVVSAHEIARRASLNKSVVANLLKEFVRHGVLDSVRGLKGGYRLARCPREISLQQILEVVEGPFSLVDCIAHGVTQGGAKGEPHGGSANGRGPTQAGLLALASSMNSAERDAAGSASCSLYSYCPSKRPMHLVHERMLRLFREIRLDELCNLDAPPADAARLAAPPARLTGRPAVR
jgi:Rrf2 family protein